MKKISGSLKLELAQFREMAAFSKFGSDLDESTLQLLRRGDRLTELLKQPQYVPLSLGKEIISVWIGVNGYCDSLAVDQVLQFEKGLFNFIENNPIFAPYLETISLELDEEVLHSIIAYYNDIEFNKKD